MVGQLPTGKTSRLFQGLVLITIFTAEKMRGCRSQDIGPNRETRIAVENRRGMKGTMRDKVVGWSPEQCEMGLNEIYRRVILAPAPGREGVVWHPGPSSLATVM